MGRFIEKSDKPWLWGGGGIGAGLTIGFVLAHIQAIREWPWDIIAQPVATLGAGFAAIIAAGIALHNGEKTREQDKEIHEAQSRAEQERALRERFTSIIEMLSNKEADFTKRESGAYALAALADDWAAFYEDDPESSLKEQQVCLNILTGQLRDPIKEDPPSELHTFKERIQNVIFSRFTHKGDNNLGEWSNLELDLSNSFLYNPQVNATFNRSVSFSGATFKGTLANFDNTQFYSRADFSQANFCCIANFNYSFFQQEAIFHRIHFACPALFIGATFKNYLSIFESYFNEVHFKSAKFYDEIYPAYVKTNGDISFQDAEFYANEEDSGIKQLKELGANITGAKFDVNFSHPKRAAEAPKTTTTQEA